MRAGVFVKVKRRPEPSTDDAQANLLRRIGGRSANGGQNWATFASGLGPYGAPIFAIDPVDPATMYLYDGYMYRSADSGAHWALATEGLGARAGRHSALDSSTE